MKNIQPKVKKEIKRMPTQLKLKKAEFYDVYGISLLYNNLTLEKGNEYLLNLLLPLAQKYFDITYQALGAELRHFVYGSPHDDINDDIKNQPGYSVVHAITNNRRLLRILKIKNFYKIRKQLSLQKIYRIFSDGYWCAGYGGHRWGEICLAAINLQNSLKTNKVPKICQAIDALNQLEHNTSLYLQQYCSFCVFDALDGASDEDVNSIFLRCSDIIIDLLKFRKNANLL